MNSECQAYSVKTRALTRKRRVGAAVEVLREQRLALGVGEEIGEQRVEMLDRHRIVVVPPDDAGRSRRRGRRICPSGCGRCGRRCRRPAGRVRRYALRGPAARVRRAAARRGSSARRPGPRKPKRSAPKSLLCSPVSIIKRFLSNCRYDEFRKSDCPLQIRLESVKPDQSAMSCSK